MVKFLAGMVIGVLIGLTMAAHPATGQPRSEAFVQWTIGIVIGATGNYVVREGMRAARELSACGRNPNRKSYQERAGRVWLESGTDPDEAIAVVRSCGVSAGP